MHKDAQVFRTKTDVLDTKITVTEGQVRIIDEETGKNYVYDNPWEAISFSVSIKGELPFITYFDEAGEDVRGFLSESW